MIVKLAFRYSQVTDGGRLSDDNSMLSVRRNNCPLDSDSYVERVTATTVKSSLPAGSRHQNKTDSPSGELTIIPEVDRIRLSTANKKLLRSWRSEFVGWQPDALKVEFNGTEYKFNTY